MPLLDGTDSPTEIATALHAIGFSDASRSLRLLASCARTDEQRAALAPVGDALLAGLGQSADPMRALLNFSNLCDRLAPDHKVPLFSRLQNDGVALERLTQLESWSQSLAD